MHYSYTGGRHKNMLDRFSLHQINTPSSCCYLSKFCCRKETWGYARVIHKKRKRKKLEKMDTKVSKIFKIMGTSMPA
jgi:hypothetical protein